MIKLTLAFASRASKGNGLTGGCANNVIIAKITDKIKNDLADISVFNIQVRYDDYKLSFFKKASKKFTAKYLKITKEILIWLKEYQEKKALSE